MRPGVRLAIDLGTNRIGVARSDAAGILHCRWRLFTVTVDKNYFGLPS